MTIYDHLDHFTAPEFGVWADRMDYHLLRCLDTFRKLWGKPVVVSPVDGALGRKLGYSAETMHNVTRWGKVMAVDFFPKDMRTEREMKRAFKCAKEAGFTGIGLYTDTQPSYMMHGDVQPLRLPSNPATWSRVNGKYLAIEKAWE